MTPEEAFGSVLRTLRKGQGLSQEQLAMESGVERNYVSLLELGKNSVTMRVLFRLSAILSKQPSEILAQVEAELRERD